MTNPRSDQPKKKPLAASTMLRRARYASKAHLKEIVTLRIRVADVICERDKLARTLTNQSAARIALQNEVESDNETMRRQEQIICNLRTEIIELRQRVGTDSQKATTVLTKCVKALAQEPMATSEAGCVGLYAKPQTLAEECDALEKIRTLPQPPIAPELVKTDEIPGWMQLCGWSALVILLVTFIVAELNLYGVFH